MTSLTDSLSQFVANPSFPELPERALKIVQSGFIDTIATMIAGQNEPVVAIVQQFVEERKSAAREARVLLGHEMAASADAALINGTAAHALDYDDVALSGHPSTVLVPAVLAEGERLNVSGTEAIRAYLVGYEVWAELLSREQDAYHVKGWHPTAVLGTIGTAAAVAYLHKLSAEQCRNAIAIAASMASGLVANFGTMTKPLHAGRAAACGVEAVRLAASGLTGAMDVMEHHAGYLAALSPNGRIDSSRAALNLGRKLRVLESGLSIKKYPMCYATHRVIDGMLDLIGAHDIKPADVMEVRACIGVAQASMLRNHAPVTGLEAKFSLEFAIASALVARKVGLAELTDSFVAEPMVRQLMTKVKTSTSDVPCPIEPVFALNDRVVVLLRDGRALDSGEIRFARGNAMLPLHDEELRAKFVDCASVSADLDGAGLYRRLNNLTKLKCLRELADMETCALPERSDKCEA
jgi:aconitate decarboxylase